MPDGVADVCRAGLAARIRCSCGGTAAAVQFAKLATGGHDFTAEQVGMVRSAHKRLDERLIRAGAQTEGDRVEYLLWGGDAARLWADPPSDFSSKGFTADVTTVRAGAGDPAADLSAALNAIDNELLQTVTALFDLALAQSLRATGSVVANLVAGPKASKTLRAEMVETLGAVGWDRLRTELTAEPDPARKPSMVPASIRAQLTERERAVIGRTLEPLKERLAEALEAAATAAAALVASFTGAPVSADVADRTADDRASSVEFALGALTALVTRRLDNPDIGPDESGITERPVPDALIRETIGIAGGLPHNDRGVTLDADDTLLDMAGRPRPTGVAVSAHTVDQLDIAFTDPVARSAAGVAALATLVVVHTWRSSKREFQPHTALEGRSWTSEEERRLVCGAPLGKWPFVSVYRPNPNPDHKGCGCYTEQTLRFE